ncbi:hypothetical protein KCP73_15015 [Salmonella enterica subsp. enterica]|nr:hypothetical protein KCP73_15015 [Salmonella enterica subsp. enterica]
MGPLPPALSSFRHELWDYNSRVQQKDGTGVYRFVRWRNSGAMATIFRSIAGTQKEEEEAESINHGPAGRRSRLDMVILRKIVVFPFT